MGDPFNYIRQAVEGPGAFRFIIQPLLAALLGLRDGRRDRRAGQPPYLFHLLAGGGHRKEIIRQGVRQIAVPLCIGFCLDVAIRWSMGYGFHPASSALVGCLLIGLPYSVLRGVINRLSSA